MPLYGIPLFAATVFLTILANGISLTTADEDSTYEIGLINLYKEGSEEPIPVCMVYPNEYYTLNTEAQKKYNLGYEKTVDLCQDGLTKEDFTPTKKDSLILLSVSTNCTISRYYPLIKEGNSSGIILLSNYTRILNESYGWDIFAIVRNNDIPVFLVSMSMEKWKIVVLGIVKNATKPKENTQVEVTKFSIRRFDPSLVILWLLAILCVGIGSYTGPYRILKVTPGEYDREALGPQSEPKDEAKVFEGITVPVAVGLVVFISTTLLLLYFFYQYLVYFFIFVFCLASARAMHLLIVQLVNYLVPGVNFPRIWKFGIHEILVGCISLTLPIVWFIFRHDGWVWPIQDILGVSFCIHLIQTLHLPNMKVITSILVLLFLYDVFFVFITPFFTHNGKSVMVEVATGVSGSGSKEQLPMLLQFPRLLSSPAHICMESNEYSLLGFGDIIVPGFLVCFAHVFDLRTKTDGCSRPYFITSLIAYSVGLLGAFIALILSSSGQPALFYIVPCMLLGIFSVGLMKKEVKALWRGGPLIPTGVAVEHESS